MAGYSNTPLAKKLGLKHGNVIRLINQPAHYFELFTDLPDTLHVIDTLQVKKDFIHFFTASLAEMRLVLPTLKDEIFANGTIWVSWPKKASKIPRDLTEDQIREAALACGLVDIKVCAVDEDWSGLKLVIPVKDRQ